MSKTSLVLAAALALAAGQAFAEADHDRARRAVMAGEVVPLRTILDRAHADYGGEFIEAELEEQGGRPVYEIKMIAKSGRVVKLLYDARDGRLLTAREKGGPR